MKTNNKSIDKFAIITSILALLPMVLGILMMDKLPELIPTHWNLKGEIDGYTKKEYFIFGFPLFMSAMNLYLHFMLNSDPKNKNRNFILIKFSKIILPTMSVFMISTSILVSLGYNINIQKILMIFIGLLLLIMGNYFPKSKQSYTVGIKLPWTLNSEENWKKTHRLAGFLYAISGVISILAALFTNSSITVLPLIAIIVSSIITTIYSYILYKKGI